MKKKLLSLFAAALVMLGGAQNANAEYVKLTPLSGTKDLSNGEGVSKLVDTWDGRDGRAHTKWGQSFDINNPEKNQAWLIVKADKLISPEHYFLVTGNDTNGDQKRNWRSWNIYGANFENDADATKDASWNLIDQREDAVVSVENYGITEFTLNDGVSLVTYDGTPYQYFLIEVTHAKEDKDVYLQMAEFGFGTYNEFKKYLYCPQTTGIDEPIRYGVIAGDRYNLDGESLTKLFDGDINTKWGNGLTAKNFGETTDGAYFIVCTSREIVPTYYKLVTGTDNARWNHRNWKDWQIYGIAAADVLDNEYPTRASDKWVMLDKKVDVTEEILPDKNCYTVFFTLSEENTTAYKYFKVEIDNTMSGSGYMQMSEFALGDEYTFPNDLNAVTTSAEDFFDPNLFAEKALLDQMEDAINEIKICTENTISELNAAILVIDNLKPEINQSAVQYSDLFTVRNQAINQINDDNLTTTAVTYITAWISESDIVAPNEEYPVGNFAYIKANRQLTGIQAAAEAQRISEYLVNNVKIVDNPINVTYEAVIDANGFNDNEKGHSLIDGNRENTKWCASTEHKPWLLVFKSSEPIKPTYYGLVTGGDTYSYPDRNWKTWKIWAANFDSDADVTAESEQWELIDEKNNVGTDILKTTNKYESYINLSIGCTKKYKYFKILVEASGGNLIQMNEFTFYNLGNLNEYREKFVNEFAEFAADLNALVVEDDKTDKKTTFATLYEELQTTAYAVRLMEIYNELTALRTELKESAAYMKLTFDDDIAQLATKTDLVNFAQVVASRTTLKGALTADIDMAGVVMKPIGTNVNPYKGTFDGQGFTIENYTYENADKAESGLFGVAAGATIKNILLKGARIVGNENIGGIVGRIYGGTIQNCAVISSYVEGRDHVGAIAGEIRDNATIQNCYSDAEIYSRGYQAGGLAGTSRGGSFLNNLFLGSINCAGGSVGGVVALIDAEDNSVKTTIQKNVVAATSINLGWGDDSFFYLTNINGKSPEISDNYVLTTTKFRDDKTLADVTGGNQGTPVADAKEITCKSFYATTLGWNMTDDWKFIAVGEFPVLAYMEAAAPAPQTISVTEAGYATVVAEKELDFAGSGVEAFVAQIKTDPKGEKYVHFEPMTVVPEGEAFVVKADKGNYDIPVAIEWGEALDNDLKASDTEVTADGTQFVLANGSKGVGFYKAEANSTIAAGKGYLEISGEAGVKGFYGFEFNDATGIEETLSNSPLKGENIFNLAGQRLNKMQKGINIVGGKKVLK